MRPQDNAGMGFPAGDTDSHRMLADITARAEKLRHTAAGVAARLAETSGTGRSPDGAVTAIVAPTGALKDIQVTARAMGMKPEQLSRSIMAAVRAAQAQASQALVAAFTPLGEGKDTMSMILDHIPKPEADDQPAGEEEPEFAAIEDTQPHPVPPTPPPPAAKAPQPRPRSTRPGAEEDVDNDPW